MRKLDKRQLLSIGETFRLHETDLAPILRQELTSLGYDVVRGDDFAYAPGKIPVMLVAHYDTVHAAGPAGRLAEGLSIAAQTKCADCGHALDAGGQGNHWTYCKNPKAKTSAVVFADGGLGADDRAGVWLIREILRAGFRPHVLYCDKEESHGVGARKAARALKDDVLKADVRLLVELDRMNAHDCVFYQCDNADAVAYCESFGFKKSNGSYTDICELMKDWAVAGVNLSVGYYCQHTDRERWHVDEALVTKRRVEAMLKAPPAARLPFVDRWRNTQLAAGVYPAYGGSEEIACHKCGRVRKKYDLALRDHAAGPWKWECWDECVRPEVECRLCWKTVARKDASKFTRFGRQWWECADGASCVPPSAGLHLRADGLYHLAGGDHRRCALVLAEQLVGGPTPRALELADAMGPDKEAALERDLWEKERKCLDDYCPHCRQFVFVYASGKCSDCDTLVLWRDDQPARRARARTRGLSSARA